jgi:glycosyltransferase involved in cell wall biosynthesis
MLRKIVMHISVMNTSNLFTAPQSTLIDADSASAMGLIVDELPAREQSLRIAVVTETYPPEVNGVSLTVARFVEGLRARHHDIQLIRPRQSRLDMTSSERGMQQVLLRGLPIPRYPQLKMGLPAKGALVKMWSFRRPDVVHIVTEGPLGWSALQAARKLKLPVTSDFRTNFHAYSRHYGIGWLQKPIFAYLRKFHNHTSATLVPTESLRAELAAMGFRNTHVVARGVDTERFSPARRSITLRQQWGADENTTVAIYVGRLASEKNLGLLIEAYEAMREKDSRMKLVIVGDGPMRIELQGRCPNAIFAGQQVGDDLAMHYASGDVFIFPSMTETYGNVTPEAMGSGLALLAYDYAAASQLIVNNQNGMLAPLGNARAFVEQAAALAIDKERIRALRLAARLTAESTGWPAVVAEFESVLRDAIRNDGSHQVFGAKSSLATAQPS